jgi:CRP/FNR family transcriptional regulator
LIGGNGLVEHVKDIAFLEDTLNFWKKLNRAQKNFLQQAIVKKQFATGESMHSTSEHCSGLFLIKHGQIRAYIISEGGREITLYHLFDRDVCIFTASCLMKNIAFDVNIEVEKETQAYLIPSAAFRKLSDESIPVQIFTNQLMASRFSDVMWIMEQALFTSFDKRLANFLLEQSVIGDSDTLVMTHEKIANHLGTAREVVTRMLKYFQTEGMVSLNRGTIEILDQDKLNRIIG